MVCSGSYGIFFRFTQTLDFIAASGSKTQASQRFSVARSTLYKWLNAPDPLARQKPGPRPPRTLDADALKKHVAEFPDQTYAERAAHFGVSKSYIGYGLKNIGCTRKKLSAIRSDARKNDKPIFSNSQR